MLVRLLACASAGVLVLLLSGCCCCIPFPGPRARSQGGSPPSVELPAPRFWSAPPEGWLSARGRLREGVQLFKGAEAEKREYGTVVTVPAPVERSTPSPNVLVSQVSGQEVWKPRKELEGGLYFISAGDPALRPAR